MNSRPFPSKGRAGGPGIFSEYQKAFIKFRNEKAKIRATIINI